MAEFNNISLSMYIHSVKLDNYYLLTVTSFCIFIYIFNFHDYQSVTLYIMAGLQDKASCLKGNISRHRMCFMCTK